MPAENSPHPFAPGDRVVAVDTRQGPLLWEDPRDKNLITTPDGPPRKGVVYYVEGIMHTKCGSPGVIITGLRSYWKNLELPWCASRFRKVDTLKGHIPKKRRIKQPAVFTHHEVQRQTDPVLKCPMRWGNWTRKSI